MNIERMVKAIELMLDVGEKRPESFDLQSWQWCFGPAQTIEDLQGSCGSTACFGGWLALSPEFQGAGGKVGVDGAPHFWGAFGFTAVANYLSIARFQAYNLCIPSEAPRYYRKESREVDALDVAEKLIELLKEHTNANGAM